MQNEHISVDKKTLRMVDVVMQHRFRPYAVGGSKYNCMTINALFQVNILCTQYVHCTVPGKKTLLKETKTVFCACIIPGVPS